jgi:hypothetical protein
MCQKLKIFDFLSDGLTKKGDELPSVTEKDSFERSQFFDEIWSFAPNFIEKLASLNLFLRCIGAALLHSSRKVKLSTNKSNLTTNSIKAIAAPPIP